MVFNGKIWARKNSAVFLQVTIFQGNGVYFANIIGKCPDLGLRLLNTGHRSGVSFPSYAI